MKELDLTNWQARQLNVNEVAAILGASVGQVWRLARQGKFPKPFKVSANTTRWGGAEVAQYLIHMKATTTGTKSAIATNLEEHRHGKQAGQGTQPPAKRVRRAVAP